MEFDDFKNELAARTRRAAARATDMAAAARLFEDLAEDILKESGGPVVLFTWYPELLDIPVTLRSTASGSRSALSVMSETAIQALVKVMTSVQTDADRAVTREARLGTDPPKQPSRLSDRYLLGRVTESYQLAVSGDLEGSRRIVSDMIFSEESDAKDIIRVMSVADPERIVWAGPVPKDATGVGGLPLVEARFDICSDSYGLQIDRLFGTTTRDDEFLDACVEGFENTTLHDKGYVAYDGEAGSYVFLVGYPLEPEDEIDLEALRALGEAHDVEARAMAYSHTPIDLGGGPGARVVVAVVSRVSHLGSVPEIICEIEDRVVHPRPTRQM